MRRTIKRAWCSAERSDRRCRLRQRQLELQWVPPPPRCQEARHHGGGRRGHDGERRRPEEGEAAAAVVHQAQFAGYFAPFDQGLYKKQGLDVQILEGGVDIVPQTVLAQGNADFAIAWVPQGAGARGRAAPTSPTSPRSFQRSGTLQVSFKDKNISTAAA
jgi:hypothetical protein